MGSGLSAKRKVAVCETVSRINLDVGANMKTVVCETQISDADSSGCDEDIPPDQMQPEQNFEQRRAIKLKGLIEENLETGNSMSPNEAIQYLMCAERASKAYGYQRHINECMANLEIYPKRNDFNSKVH